jgi:hypothetical protein
VEIAELRENGMNREDIIRMARKAGDCLTDKRGRQEFFFDSYGIERFSALVAAAEREHIAKEFKNTLKVAEERGAAAERDRIASEWDGKMYGDLENIDIGNAIRARGSDAKS